MPESRAAPRRSTAMSTRDVQGGDGAEVEFDALEYDADDAFHTARYAFRSGPGDAWTIEREGRAHLALGGGYRLLRSRVCGVCSTDLDRRFLPFPLPQITGHEVVVEDDAGRRFVVEINASHAARGEPLCAFCAAGLETHCPSRLVLGIHDLPGGFGPWVLAPHDALVPLPDSIPDETAALIEPFAAALHAVQTIDPQPGSRIAVLGPRRLGGLAIAALAAHRRRSGRAFEIVALARRSELAELALALGADRAEQPPATAAEASPLADVVIDTTGTPEGLALACALARSEVHLKSTHGRPALGCSHLTEAVVDEIELCGAPGDTPSALADVLARTERRCAADRLRVGWLCEDAPPAEIERDGVEIVSADDAAQLLARLEAEVAGRDAAALPRVDAVIIDDANAIDAVLRPDPEREASALRPRGTLVVHTRPGTRGGEQPAIARVLASGLRITTSRCGDFREALALIEADTHLRRLGDTFVSHRFDASAMGEAFDAARSPSAIKVLVAHPLQAGLPPI